MDHKLMRPIFCDNPKNYKIKIGQLFDLQDENFLDSSVLKTDESSTAIRIFDNNKKVKFETFYKPFKCEFISSLVSDDLITQLKAHANLGLFKILTTDKRIISPNADALISIKFIFRKKVLKLNEINANSLELNEKMIAKSQFAVTEIELGQWILVSMISKNDEEDGIQSKMELLQTFLEQYFSISIPNFSEPPMEASNFLYKFITSESIITKHNQEFISFKEFFELLKNIWDKNRCFPISVKLTSLLDLGLLTIDDRLTTLQTKYEAHEFLLNFFIDSEIAIHKLQESLNSNLAIFSVKILKQLRQIEIYLSKVMGKFKTISLQNETQLIKLQKEIEASNLLFSINTFLQNLESQYFIKNSNFIETQTQALFNLSNSNVKFCLIIGENEKQKIDFIKFLINTSQCSSAEEALTYKMSTFLAYSNASKRKSIILTKNSQYFVFIIISKMDFYNTLSQENSTHEITKIFGGDKQLHSVILLFSNSKFLKKFHSWIPLQLSKATNNFIYLNFFTRKPLNAEKWKMLVENLPTGSLYFLNSKILKQNFIQMKKEDLEMGIQKVQQILRKISQMKIIDGMIDFRQTEIINREEEKEEALVMDNLKTDAIFYDTNMKRGISFFDEGIYFTNDDSKIFKQKSVEIEHVTS